MPGKVEYQQAKAFRGGEFHRATITTTLFNDRIRELRIVRAPS